MILFRSADGGILWDNEPERFMGAVDRSILSKKLQKAEEDFLYLVESHTITNEYGHTRFTIYLSRSG